MASSVDGSRSLASGRSAIHDPLSPYVLHHSDNPGLSLVSQPLIGDNYSSWSRVILIALTLKNKVGFIDGSIMAPDATDSLFQSWIRNNNVVISWILNSVSKEIYASIMFSTSAVEIWNDLRESFQQSNGPRIFQLHREIISLTQDNMSVRVYFTKLKSLWDELSNFRLSWTCEKCTCGGVKDLSLFHQNEYVMQFLLGLNEAFTQVWGLLLLMEQLPHISKVF